MVYGAADTGLERPVEAPIEAAEAAGPVGASVEPWEVARPLVRAAQSGDLIALGDLLELLTPYVRRLCGPIARADSADAVQESLIVVFRHLGQLKDPAALYAWVRTIAVREAVRVARRAARETPVERIEDVGGAGGSRRGGGGVAFTTSGQELAAEVHDVLGRLTAEHRAVLVLRELEGLDEAAASAVLDISRGTVKSRLHRARRNFREAWTR